MQKQRIIKDEIGIRSETHEVQITYAGTALKKQQSMVIESTTSSISGLDENLKNSYGSDQPLNNNHSRES